MFAVLHLFLASSIYQHIILHAGGNTLQTWTRTYFSTAVQKMMLYHTQRLRTQLEFSITAEIFETQSAGFFGKNPKSNIVFLIISWVWEHQKMNWRALNISHIFNCLRKKEEETGVEGGDGESVEIQITRAIS